jgi:protein-disulfide isomerase
MRNWFKRLSLPVVLLGLTVGLPAPAEAEGISEGQAESMLQELKQIRLLLQKMQRQNVTPANRRAVPSAKVKVSLGGGYSLGEETAAVTLVEFADYQCPFCRKFHTSTFKQLKKNYIDSGKLRYVSRDLPLRFHKHALKAAQAARCAGDQGKFWELRHVLIANGKKLSPEAILDFAQGLSLDMEPFRNCFNSKKYVADIQRDMSEANAAGITGTPAFVLGKTAKDGVDGVRIVGAQPYTVFEAKIRELLKTN